MSRFRIYQIDHFDPKVYGKKKRSLYYIFLFLTALLIVLNNLIVFSEASYLFTIVVLTVWIVVCSFLYAKLLKQFKKFKTIGEIEFTRTSINKIIGATILKYDFQNLIGLDIERHIPSVTMRDSKSGFLTYILRIRFKDLSSISIVVSDKPAGKKQNISIVDTMKTLKRISQLEITIQ